MGVDLLEFDQKQDLKVLVKYGCYDNTFLEKLSFSVDLMISSGIVAAKIVHPLLLHVFYKEKVSWKMRFKWSEY